MDKPVLHLNVKRKWFDKLKSGEKKHEYRECKEYWIKRLLAIPFVIPKGWDEVHIKNGYRKDAEVLKFKYKGIKILTSGINTDLKIDKKVFDIELGDRIS